MLVEVTVWKGKRDVQKCTLSFISCPIYIGIFIQTALKQAKKKCMRHHLMKKIWGLRCGLTGSKQNPVCAPFLCSSWWAVPRFFFFIFSPTADYTRKTAVSVHFLRMYHITPKSKNWGNCHTILIKWNKQCLNRSKASNVSTKPLILCMLL